MAALEKNAETVFLERVAATLRASSDPSTAPAIAAFVQSGLAAARRFGLTREADVAFFLSLTWTAFGGLPHFPRPALAILCTHSNDPRAKLARYANWVAAEQTPADDDTDDDDYDDDTDTGTNDNHL